MGINNKAKVEKKSSRGRAKQLADAQVVYRRKMRDEGYQRLQEWVPEDTMTHLKEISERLGVSRRDVLERLVSEARNGYIELARDAS
jgi:DNA-binding transcriptional regulator LsrR (DeoR family)